MQNDILFGIMLTLLTKKRCTARELSEKYEMSVRTIYRYLDALNQAGVPIVSFTGAKGGVAIADNFKLDKTYFTEAEYEKILTSLSGYDRLTNSQENAAIIDKFKALSDAQETQYVLQSDSLFVDAPVSDSIKNKLSAFRQAVHGCKICDIAYHSRKGEITQRTILPHAFAFKNGQWYIYAFCRTRNDFRLFKLSRVYSVVVGSEHFERMPLPPKRIEEDEYIAKERVELSLAVKEKCRLDAEEWLGIENVVARENDCYASSRQVFDDELVSRLLSFGDGITILSPEKVKIAVRKKLLAALKVYEKS